jgi:hypothetical protein
MMYLDRLKYILQNQDQSCEHKENFVYKRAILRRADHPYKESSQISKLIHNLRSNSEL